MVHWVLSQHSPPTAHVPLQQIPAPPTSLQLSRSATLVYWHAPLLQVSMVQSLLSSQSVPQAPQFLTSVSRSVQVGGDPSPPQQPGVPSVQRTPQPPQSVIVVMFVSQPAWPVQSSKPTSHTKLQVPSVHAPVACGAVQSVCTQHSAFATQFPLQQIPALAPLPHLTPSLVGVCAQVPASQVSLVHGLSSLQLMQLVPQAVLLVFATQVLPLGHVSAGQTQVPPEQIFPFVAQLVQVGPHAELVSVVQNVLLPEPQQACPTGQVTPWCPQRWSASAPRIPTTAASAPARPPPRVLNA